MSKTNDKNKFIKDSMSREGVSQQTRSFYIFLLECFTDHSGSIPMNSTTEKLAADYGRSGRTIRRYINELRNEHSYIRLQPVYNNENPDKTYIEYNIYHLLDDSVNLIEKAEAFANRHTTVYFRKNEQLQL